MSEYETISIRREGNIGRIAFNRPDKLNTFDTQLRLEFLAAARELNLDDSLRAIVLPVRVAPLVLVPIYPRAITVTVWVSVVWLRIC